MQDLIVARRQQIAELCRRHHVQRLDVFGSATRADFDAAHSDIDFLVEFDAAAPANLFDAFFDLRQQLSALLGRPVDLVMPSALRNPYVKASIETSREPLYAA